LKKRRTGYRRGKDSFQATEEIALREPLKPLPGKGAWSETTALDYMRNLSFVLVDGYNFIFRIRQEETRDLHSQQSDSAKHSDLEVFRNQLVDNCSEVYATYKTYKLEEVNIIFDGKYPAPTSSAPPQSGVQVFFSKNGMSADDEIVRRIQQYPSTKSIGVVTDDYELRRRCEEHGATIMSSTQFWNIFAKKS